MMNLDGLHWRFAADVYGKPGVAESCLYLQDSHGVDANVLLLSLYAARSLGLVMDEGRITVLDDAARQLREMVICPLRQSRRALKSLARDLETQRLRAMIQEAELLAEQYEQAKLADILLAWEGSEHRTALELTAETVVRFYSRQHCGEALGPESRRAIDVITRSANTY